MVDAPEIPNPVDPSQTLKRPPPEDTALTKAEKLVRNGPQDASEPESNAIEPPAKRVKLDSDTPAPPQQPHHDGRDKRNGDALVKPEYLIRATESQEAASKTDNNIGDDDAAEAAKHHQGDDRDRGANSGGKKQKNRGQNKDRHFGSSRDSIQLCNSRATAPEFSPDECRFGDRCTLCHDLRKYLKEGRREDLTTFEGKCPVFEANGVCNAGWKCRFVKSHSEEVKADDGRMELRLIERKKISKDAFESENAMGVVNIVSGADKLALSRRKMKTERADQYTEWLEKDGQIMEKVHNVRKDATDKEIKDIEDRRAQFTDPPFKPSEKRRIYFGAETPALAPLTTQGNLPYRRLCVELGAQLTYSEMALTMPLIQGNKSEWALMKAHESEIVPPRYSPSSPVKVYDNSKDLRFGAQVSAPKPWQAVKAAEAMARLLPHLRLIDLNCGCPIDLVYQSGAGSALLDSPTKLEKMIRGMNAVSGEIPITAKIRMGTKDSRPNALKNIERLALGGPEARERLGAPGCAAITLHGRSRQQRYTRKADWSYIAECAALVKSYNEKKDEITDTIREPDASTLPNAPDGKIYFLGNGDVYSHVDYYQHIEEAKVDSVMVGRGALIKPWIFEEIEKGQYLDKSATERLSYIEKFVRYGLEAWGSDEVGVGQTRRFLLEWLSFTHRYVPIGILAHLPPSLQDRPPAYRSRNDLEGLLASGNYKDWIKISDMFLGPAHKDFTFQPKHKSNSYEIEAEG